MSALPILQRKLRLRKGKRLMQGNTAQNAGLQDSQPRLWITSLHEVPTGGRLKAQPLHKYFRKSHSTNVSKVNGTASREAAAHATLLPEPKTLRINGSLWLVFNLFYVVRPTSQGPRIGPVVSLALGKPPWAHASTSGLPACWFWTHVFVFCFFFKVAVTGLPPIILSICYELNRVFRKFLGWSSNPSHLRMLPY